MTARARIVTALTDTDHIGQIDHALQQAGYASTIVTDPAVLSDRIDLIAPDLVLIGQHVGDVDGFALFESLSEQLKKRQCAVALLADNPDRDLYLKAFDANFDDVISLPVQDDVLAARARPLTRLSIMWSEMHLRSGLAKRFGIQSQAPDQVWNADGGTVMYVGKSEIEFTDLQGVLDSGFKTLRADNAFAALDKLESTTCDAVVFSAEQDRSSAFDLCARVRTHPRLSTLPIVLLTGDMDKEEIATAYRSGVTRICRQPMDAQMMRATVSTLIRRQSFHWRVAGELDKLITNNAAGDHEGMVSEDYMTAYLQARLPEDADGGDFALTYLRAETADQLARDVGAEAADHLVAQLAPYVSRMLRAEDLAISDGSGGFFCLLPKTGLAEARLVMERITGIIAVTDFAIKDVFHPVKVWPRFATTLATAADTPGTILAALKAGLSSALTR